MSAQYQHHMRILTPFMHITTPYYIERVTIKMCN